MLKREKTISSFVFFLLISSISFTFIFLIFFFRPNFNLINLKNFMQILWFICATLIGQIIIFLIGFTFFHFFPKNESIPHLQRIALIYGLGAGILILSMFLVTLAGIDLRFSYVPILIIVLILFFYFKLYKNLMSDFKLTYNFIKKLKFNKIELFCIFLLCIELFYLISYWFLYPIRGFDAVYLWDARGRAFFYDKNLDFLKNPFHSAYPILVPLMLSFFYSLYGQPYHFSTIINISFFITLLLFIYRSLRHFKLNRTYSILLTTLLALSGKMFYMATDAYADLALAFFYTIGTIFIFYYINTKKSYYLLYASIFMGFMTWCKVEGFFLLFTNLFVLTLYELYLFFKNRTQIKLILKTISLCLLPAFLIYLPWLLYIILNKIPFSYLASFFINNIFTTKLTINDIYRGIRRFIILIIDPTSWGIIFWFVIFILTIINKKIIIKERNLFLSILILFHFLLYIFVYLSTPFSNFEIHMIQSLSRMLLHIAPLYIFFLGILFIDNQKIISNFEDEFYRYVLFFFIILVIVVIIFLMIFYDTILLILKIYFPYYGINEL